MSAVPTVQTVLANSFRRYRDRTCIAWEGGSLTYAEVENRVSRLALWLQEATPAEAHVAILLPNSRAYLELILACALAGRVRVPLNPKEPFEAQLHKIQLCEASLVVTTAAWSETLRDHLPPGQVATLIVRGDGEDSDYERIAAAGPNGSPALVTDNEERYRLSFTGGTTGAPKAVVSTHRKELAMLRNLLLEAIVPKQSAPFVASTPLSHASGAFVLPTVVGGGILSWTDGFDPVRLADASWLGDELSIQSFLVPTALGDMADATHPRTRIDRIVYGGAPCGAAVLDRAVDRIGKRLVQVYGQAEAPMTICVLGEEDHQAAGALAGCVGYPFAFVDVSVESGPGVPAPQGEIGEVIVRAEHVMSGYWKNAEASAEKLGADGALLTQDTGYFDERGWLWLSGRSRELIISGGYNVYPAEVEKRLGRVAGVREVAVFSVPHERWGEAVVAAVVPDGSVDEGTLRDRIEGASREALANYERPKSVVLMPQLPETSLGKVSRRALTELHKHLFTAVERQR